MKLYMNIIAPYAWFQVQKKISFVFIQVDRFYLITLNVIPT